MQVHPVLLDNSKIEQLFYGFAALFALAYATKVVYFEEN